MKTIRIALWAVVALVAVAVGALAFQTARGPQAVAGIADIGGPFTLTNQHGETVTRDDLIGSPHVVFFGYTYCPDVCPTTLWELSQYMAALGEKADDLKVVFVSVDPDRDTPDALSDYIAAFDDRIIGLTGSREAIDEAVNAYRAYYKIHPEDEHGDVLIDHTATTYLFDETGAFTGTIAYQERADTARAKLERLVGA